MPPKSSTSKLNKSVKSDKDIREAIDRYLSQKPDFDKLIAEAKANTQPAVQKHQSDFDKKLNEAVKQLRIERQKQATTRPAINMPPKEDQKEGEFSILPHPAKDNQPGKGPSVGDHHKATPGPVMAQTLGQPASKEELRKRAEELNKK